MRRHDHAPHRDHVEQPGQEHGSGGTEGDEAEVARVEPRADGDVEDSLGDVAAARSPRVVDPLSDPGPCRAGRRPVRRGRRERHAAVEEPAAVEDPHEQSGVGEGRAFPALAVARWARLGTGRVRADLDLTGRGHPHDRAPACAERDDVRREGVDDEVVFQFERGVHPGLAVETTLMSHDVPPTSAQSRFGSSMKRPRWAHSPSPPPAADDELVRRSMAYRPAGHRRAVGEVQLTGEALRQSRLDRAVYARYSSFISTSTIVVVDRMYSRTIGDTSLEIETATSPSTSCTSSRSRRSCCGSRYALSRQIATPSTSQWRRSFELLDRLLLVERDEHLALGGEALADAAAQVARHERTRHVSGRAPPRKVRQRVEGSPQPAPVEDVPVTVRQEPDLRDPPGDDRVQPGGTPG